MKSAEFQVTPNADDEVWTEGNPQEFRGTRQKSRVNLQQHDVSRATPNKFGEYPSGLRIHTQLRRAPANYTESRRNPTNHMKSKKFGPIRKKSTEVGWSPKNQHGVRRNWMKYWEFWRNQYEVHRILKNLTKSWQLRRMGWCHENQYEIQRTSVKAGELRQSEELRVRRIWKKVENQVDSRRMSITSADFWVTNTQQ